MIIVRTTRMIMMVSYSGSDFKIRLKIGWEHKSLVILRLKI
jgi:hypothetical protein